MRRNFIFYGFSNPDAQRDHGVNESKEPSYHSATTRMPAWTATALKMARWKRFDCESEPEKPDDPLKFSTDSSVFLRKSAAD